jgi:hypothetical protein
VLTIGFLSACSTSTTIDEYRITTTQLKLNEGEKIVIMGRRHAGEYETEPNFINCIGNHLAGGGKRIPVIPEQQFLDTFYPWFEPRVAPLRLTRMARLLKDPLITRQIKALGVRYMVWVDGNTETTDKNGSFSCAIGPGGGGCFGFASWDKASVYEAVIWDLNKLDEKGRVKVETKGSSYLLAVGAPIPFIAQVQGDACEGIGNRLKGFFLEANTSTASTKSTDPNQPKNKKLNHQGMLEHNNS